MEVALIALVILTIILIALLLKKQTPQPAADNNQLLMMQQQLDALRSELNSSAQTTNEALARSLKDTTDTLFQSMKNTTDVMNQQLSRVEQQIQAQTSDVGTRLNNAATVIKDVQKNLGELGKATQEIKELGQSVSKLEEMLRAPKLRGGLGELLLEDLLKQVLPPDHFEVQYHFRAGQIVDAIIRTAGGMVPIDSKFPLENFRKFVETKTEAEKKSFQKAFVNDVKKHIDAVSKYILPDEGTFDFALMYIPAENVYYETIIKDETFDGISLQDYAMNKHVVPVSPNSFYAHLRVIALGLRGLQIEKSAKEIINNLSRLQGEILKVREAFDTLGSHLDNAKKKYEETDKRLAHFEDKLENISEKSIKEGEQKLLD
ncbi:MAG: DNA recombination protein RmuC [Bacteroidota bacterium]|nr:DNA recombination protein RmuC [Bacteroidota bacterium]